MTHTRHTSRGSPAGFTLVEMLTVMAIIGIIAALAVPALKNYGKNDVSVSASRQLLDDIGHARQLAMAQRSTVYMVFVPTNFWNGNTAMFTSPSLSLPQSNSLNSILGMQLTGYTFMAYGAVGDQPGRHQWHYLASWQSLPGGVFIPMWKFFNPAGGTPPPPFAFTDPLNTGIYFNINPFSTNIFPVPTQDGTNLVMPYIAFNYLGQLAGYSGQLLTAQTTPGYGYDQDFIGGGVDIPLTQGSVLPPANVQTKALQPGNPQVIESPPGNTTNVSYNVIHIDPLTGRATLEFHKQQ